MDLTLSDDERALLVELLDADYRELKEEIGKTEAFDYKESLRARERLLESLIAKVGSPPR